MAGFDGWEKIRVLGEGGQGIVSLARSPEARSRRQTLLSTIQNTVRDLPDRSLKSPDKLALSLADALAEYVRGDSPSELGALKEFKIPTGSEAGKQAMQRFQTEVEALSGSRNEANPGIIRLLHSNVDQHFIITEFHPQGALSDHAERFKGDALAALRALHPLVQAVAALHASGVIHRDIKPDNVFLASDGRLVLGDFGIVFFEDSASTRVTDTYENVGSRDWMPAWAFGQRIEDLSPNFDVFCLGKLLWAMVAGRTKLLLWYFKDEGNNLEALFPDDSSMGYVNEILEQCVVQRPSQCLEDAAGLLAKVENAIRALASGADRFVEDSLRRCRACGRNTLDQPQLEVDGNKNRKLAVPLQSQVARFPNLLALYDAGLLQSLTVRIFLCSYCGYLELFHWPDGMPRDAWSKRL